MKRFLTRLFVFTGINLAPIIMLVIIMMIRDHNPRYANAESVIHTIPQRTAYDLVIMGTSHGKQFSMGANSVTVNDILHMNILNLGKDVSGILPAKIYLSYFFDQGNRTKNIIYFLDPFVFNTTVWNEGPLIDEPLRITILFELVKALADRHVIYRYITSNLTAWARPIKNSGVIDDKPLLSLNQTDINKSILSYYPNSTNTILFAKYARYLKSVVEMAQSNNTRIIFILPPSLMQPDPGKEMVISLLSQYQQTYHVKFYDLSNSLKNIEYFGGYGGTYDHLNHAGIQYFTEYFLKPIL